VAEVPRVQCRLWGTCHALIAIVIVCDLLLPHFRFVQPWRQFSLAATEQLAIAATAAGRVVFFAWLAGAAVSLFLFAREWVRAFQFLKTCRSAEEWNRGLTDRVQALWKPMQHAKDVVKVNVLISDHIGSPFCCQWHRPSLVLPGFMEDLDGESLDSIARHELEHLRSGHPLQLFVERVIAIVFWFHPAIWWALRQSSVAREFACDDAAVSGRREIVKYLKTLLALAERGLTEESEGAVLFFGRGASVIARRGKRLLNRAENPDVGRAAEHATRMQLTIGLVAIVMAIAWLPLNPLASPRTPWSPWPSWSATSLHSLDVPARDFEPYDRRSRLHELAEAQESD
jgi:bla regulator protein BlaR1